MSKETINYLNTNTLIGYTEKRGNAWHYRAEEQGTESNHYTSSIPVEDVRRRLFAWTALEGAITATAITPDGVMVTEDSTRKAIMRSDTGALLGIFKTGYKVHPYSEWLIQNVENLLDADLAIASAGVLKGGAVAWVQIEMEETLTTSNGFEFRPFLTAATSMDGSLATTYLTGAQAVVCDNTLSTALNEKVSRIKIKHSTNSLKRIGEAREALGIVYETADVFTAQVEALSAEVVSQDRWNAFLKAYAAPSTESKTAATLSSAKIDSLDNLWRNDLRVAPWAGSAFGVLQAVNTYTHHIQNVRGGVRADRNMERSVTGMIDQLDRDTLRVLATV